MPRCSLASVPRRRSRRPIPPAAVLLSVTGLLLVGAAAPAAGWAPDGSPVCVAAGDQIDPILLEGGAVVWNDYRHGRSGIYYRQAIDEGTWFEPAPVEIPVYVGEGTASAPRAIPFPGSILVTWSDTRNGAGNADVFVQRLDRSGIWPSYIWDGIHVCTAPGNQVDPAIADDGAGGFFIAWRDGRSESTLGKDVYLQHFHEYGQVWEGWPVDGVRVCGAPGDQEEPVVVADGAGGALVFWRDGRSGSSEFYAKGVDADGAAPSGWGQEGIPVCEAPGEQRQLRALPDGAGGAYLAWIDSRDGTPQLYAGRVSGTGSPPPGWPANGVAVSTRPLEYVDAAALCAADGGGIYLVWAQSSKGAAGVEAQRLLADGSLPAGWEPGGKVLSRTARIGMGVAAVSDGAGGVCVAWSEYGYMTDLRALRLHGSGAVAEHWPPGGALLSGADESQMLPAWRSGQPPGGPIASDGSGGAIVAWTDARASVDWDIYAQRVTGNGVIAPSGPPGCWLECAPDYVQRVYPNPTRGGFTVEGWVPESGGAWVDVLDIQGRVRHRQRYDEPGPVVRRLPVNLPRLPSGVYFVQYRLGSTEPGRVYGIRKIFLIH